MKQPVLFRKLPRTLGLCLAVLGLSASAPVSRPARAEEAAYEIQKTKTQATVGVPAKAALTVHGKNGWHVNEQAPITVSATGDPGLELPKPKLGRADLAQSTKESARFEIPFTAAAPGTKTITAEARFVMCQEQACKPMKETVALELQVADARPSTPPKARGKSAKPTAQ